MTCYIVSYDLLAPGTNYEQLYSALKTYTKWAKVNESVWAIVTEKKAVEIRTHLTQYLDANDRLFVIKSGTEAAWRNSICKNEWLKGNL
jgi:CRISPR/Cas system-associated endoribonuclease Cas2